MKVPFVDFRPLEKLLDKELHDAFERVLKNSWYIQGQECEAFERAFADYCGVKYCVGVGNGYDALVLGLRALGIGAGDEVIVPSNTFIATVLAVSAVGAVPILVEPDIRTYNINPDLIEEHISSKTKAVIAVHLYGQPCDMDKIVDIVHRNGLKLVEDCAQAHGATYKGRRVGSFGDVACFSFYPGKNLGALGDAGAVVSDDEEIIDKVRCLGNYGSDYKYHHIYLGYNSRLDELQAAFLYEKLKVLDDINNYRITVAEKYTNSIKNTNVILPEKIVAVKPVWHIYPIRSSQCEELKKYLFDLGINTGRHYPIPIHLQSCYKGEAFFGRDYPLAEIIGNQELSLPIYYGISEEQVQFVIDAVNSFI